MIEIFIIVFAVTLSIWLHDKSEHKHQQKVVKEFLLGLKEDLQNDLKEMSQDKVSYLESKAAFTYLAGFSERGSVEKDSLKLYGGSIFSSVGLVPNDGRFEGFKSSGLIGNIENTSLQNDIVDFYQEDLKTLVKTTSYYSDRKEKFFDFYLENFKKTGDSTNIISLLSSDVGQNYVRTLGSLDEILIRYDNCISKANKIITAIDNEFK